MRVGDRLADSTGTMGTRILLVLVVIATTLCCWLGFGSDPTQRPIRAAIAVDPSTLAGKVARSGVGLVREANLASLSIARHEAICTAPAESRCCVRLVGLLPGVPWSAPLQWRFRTGNQLAKLSRSVDAEGVSLLLPPDGAEQLESLHFRANDLAYRLVAASSRETLKVGKTLDLAVEPIGILRGAVVGPDGVGIGIGARVLAFRSLPNGRLGPLVAATSARSYGYFALRVPAAVDVRVVADGSMPQARAITGQVGGLLLEIEDDLDGCSDDSFSGAAELAGDARWLPAQLVARCAHGQSRELPTMRLRPRTMLTGRLVTSSGSAGNRVQVYAYPAHRTTAGRYDKLVLVHPGVLVRGGTARTDRSGRFTLQVAPGVPFVISTVDERSRVLPVGPCVTATAPGHVELVRP